MRSRTSVRLLGHATPHGAANAGSSPMRGKSELSTLETEGYNEVKPDSETPDQRLLHRPSLYQLMEICLQEAYC